MMFLFHEQGVGGWLIRVEELIETLKLHMGMRSSERRGPNTAFTVTRDKT